MFVDASALVAALKDEPDGPAYLKAMEVARGKIRVSPIVRLEAAIALARTRRDGRGDTHATAEDFEVAAELVADLFYAIGADEVVVTPAIGKDAIEAMGRYGKLTGHPAQLNMGDSLSYACARAFRIPLLYKGDDFRQTDLS